MGSADNFLLLLKSFLIPASRSLDIVGKVSKSPVTEITFFYRLIKQQIHKQLFTSRPLVEKSPNPKQPKSKPIQYYHILGTSLVFEEVSKVRSN